MVTLNLNDNAINAPQQVALVGQGVPGRVAVEPGGLSFGKQPLGQPAATAVNLINHNSVDLTIQGVG